MGDRFVQFIEWLKATHPEYAELGYRFTIEVSDSISIVIPTGGYIMIAKYAAAAYKGFNKQIILTYSDYQSFEDACAELWTIISN